MADAKRGGFTILELVVVTTLLAILIATAALRGADTLARNRLASAARQVTTDLRLIRHRAVSQSTSFRVVFTPGSGYAVERLDPGGGGWQPHALYARSSPAAPAATVIHLPQTVGVVTSETVVFEARGNATAVVRIRLRDPGLANERVVEVGFAGQVSIL